MRIVRVHPVYWYKIRQGRPESAAQNSETRCRTKKEIMLPRLLNGSPSCDVAIARKDFLWLPLLDDQSGKRRKGLPTG